jgi:hypothetical protein
MPGFLIMDAAAAATETSAVPWRALRHFEPMRITVCTELKLGRSGDEGRQGCRVI